MTFFRAYFRSYFIAALLPFAGLTFISCQTAAISVSPDGREIIHAATDPRYETLVILGTNDMHGALAPVQAKTREKGDQKSVAYEKGGATYLASQVRGLRSDFGDRLLLLDAGDCFQGTLESNLQEGAPMVRFLNSLGYAASAIGNHEFDFGPVGPEGTPGDQFGALKARMGEANYPYLAANIIDESTGKMPAFPNTHPSVIVQSGRVKVGVIGLSTLDTPVTTRPDYVQGLDFTALKDATMREATKLRKRGADVVVVTAHVGLSCQLGSAKPGHQIRKETDPLGYCDEKSELVRYLKALPPGTIDAVVSGHSHTLVHHWIEGVPVIQGGTRNTYFNLIYLTYDLEQKKLVHDQTRIEGPIPVCPKIFANQGNCDGDAPAPAAGRGKLVTSTFRARKVAADPATVDLLRPAFELVEKAKKRVVAQAARAITHPRGGVESEMGNLVADAIRAQVKADVAIVNSGGIRAPFDAGPITFEALFRTLPFDNNVALLHVTGKELKDLLRVSQNGSKGFFPVSGVNLTLVAIDAPSRSNDLNKNGKIDIWEINRLVSARFSNGQPIEDKKMYRLATLDFLVMGGDDMAWPMSRVPKNRIEIAAGGPIRDAVEAHLYRLGVINTAEAPLIDPKQPRFRLVQGFPSKRAVRRKSPKRSGKKRIHSK